MRRLRCKSGFHGLVSVGRLSPSRCLLYSPANSKDRGSLLLKWTVHSAISGGIVIGGKIERFHYTLKKWLALQRPGEALKELQRTLEEFRPI